MKFGRTPIAEAEGAILAHATKAGADSFRKGRVLSHEDIDRLRRANVAEIVAARLEDGDIPEDEAASRVALALAGKEARVSAAFTGRCNLYATARGVVSIARDRIDAINLIHESLTVATLAPFSVVEPRQMLATVKIIPFSAPETVILRAESIAVHGAAAIEVWPFKSKRVGIVSTELASTKPSLLDKNRQVLEQRLHTLAGEIVAEKRCPHEEAAVASAIRACLAEGAELVFIYGASAIIDRRDVVPAGIVRAGGDLRHFGLPVDPGNLLLLARVGTAPVVGLPGCARSPKLNGFDWILERLLADVPITSEDIARMGAGGLLGEIHLRPQPREAAVSAKPQKAPAITAIVLAAGQSRRMGENKLLADLKREKMILHTVRSVLASAARPVVVVTGHERDAIEKALSGLELRRVHNPHYAEGLSTSLRAGLSALPGDVDGALVCLGDMPSVTPAEIDRLIAAFNPLEGRAICVPTHKGKRGNPVLWSAEFFPEMMSVAGDTGAKHLIGAYADAVCEVEMESDAVLTDIDTPEALAALRARS